MISHGLHLLLGEELFLKGVRLLHGLRLEISSCAEAICWQVHELEASTCERRRPAQRVDKSLLSWVGEGTHSWVTTTTHSWVTRPTHEWSTSSSHDSSSCFPAKEAQTGLPYPTEQKRIRFILKTYTLYSRYVYVPTKQGIRCRRKSLPPQCS